MATLGNDRDYAVYASSLDVEVAGGEWLFDLIWSHETSRTWWFILNLACEIEWSTDDNSILEDFAKLTVAVSGYRLFVFSYKTKDDSDHIVSICKDACPGSRGFRYLLVGVPKYEPIKLFVESWTL